MTKEQYDKLSKYEESFEEAKSDYYRAIFMSDLNEMNNIWEETGHERANLTCGKCVLMFLKQLGAEYFAYKEKHETAEPESTKTNVKKNAKKKQ